MKNQKRIREDCVAQPGSMAEKVADKSVCWMCSDIVRLPGRKCGDCLRFFCDRCLVNVVLSDFPRCSFGMLHQIDRVDQSLLLALRFSCRRETCSQKLTQFTYRQYWDHHSEHLQQDDAPFWKAVDQPQNVWVYDGMPSCSN